MVSTTLYAGVTVTETHRPAAEQPDTPQPDTPQPDTPQMDSNEMDTDGLEAFLTEWRAELDGQSSVAATTVQDRLLDLWATLPESPTRSEVERWLTETLARHLYQVDDVTARLERVLTNAG